MDTARISVRLTPRADRDVIVGFEGATLRVRVSAPPVEGRANVALVRVLAARLGIPQSAVHIVGGQAARTKVVAVDGLTLDAVRTRLDTPVAH